MPLGMSQNGVGRPGLGSTVVVGSETVVVVAGGVVSIDVVLVAIVDAAACVTVGSELVVFDGEPHDAAASPIVARTATLRAMSMCEVWPSRDGYVGSLTTASPRCSMSARSQ